jgi:hypothetical protein
MADTAGLNGVRSVEHQITNLGVRGSNLFGRASHDIENDVRLAVRTLPQRMILCLGKHPGSTGK